MIGLGVELETEHSCVHSEPTSSTPIGMHGSGRSCETSVNCTCKGEIN